MQRKLSRCRKVQKSCNKHRDPFKNASLALYTIYNAGLPAKLRWIQLRRQADDCWQGRRKRRRKVSHARMSQLSEQAMILAVICSPLKHWPHSVLSSSSHLHQLLLSSYISYRKDESQRKLALRRGDSIHITNKTILITLEGTEEINTEKMTTKHSEEYFFH